MRLWASEVLGAQGDFDVLPTIGSKELVAWLPSLLKSKKVLYPDVAYPTYLVGALISESQALPVGLDPSIWPEADLAWINSPSNPTGRVHSDDELQAVIDYSHRTGTIIASDECYLSFPSSKQANSILKIAAGNNQNLLAVHSLSKRSNLAGYRAGILLGDPELIARIREVRKHAGMMVPLPVQRAMTVALADEIHVAEQSARYRARRDVLQPALENAGFRVHFTESGLYIWCTRDEPDWDSVSWLADLGILATPGSFYGENSGKFIRVALTSTDAAIAQAVARLQGA